MKNYIPMFIFEVNIRPHTSINLENWGYYLPITTEGFPKGKCYWYKMLYIEINIWGIWGIQWLHVFKRSYTKDQLYKEKGGVIHSFKSGRKK